jgi:hypothetical protein
MFHRHVQEGIDIPGHGKYWHCSYPFESAARRTLARAAGTVAV